MATDSEHITASVLAGETYFIRVTGLDGAANPSYDLTIDGGDAVSISESLVVNGLSGPTSMAFAPDGRLFVTEQQGRVQIIDNGELLPTPFLTVDADATSERAILPVFNSPWMVSLLLPQPHSLAWRGLPDSWVWFLLKLWMASTTRSFLGLMTVLRPIQYQHHRAMPRMSLYFNKLVRRRFSRV